MMEKVMNRNSPTTSDRNWYNSNETRSTESCANTNPFWPHRSKTSKALTFITNTRLTLVTTSLSKETPTQCPHTRKDGLNAKSLKCSSLALSPAPKAPIVVVAKKTVDGKSAPRLCVNFQPLNDITVK